MVLLTPFSLKRGSKIEEVKARGMLVCFMTMLWLYTADAMYSWPVASTASTTIPPPTPASIKLCVLYKLYSLTSKNSVH